MTLVDDERIWLWLDTRPLDKSSLTLSQSYLWPQECHARLFTKETHNNCVAPLCTSKVGYPIFYALGLLPRFYGEFNPSQKCSEWAEEWFDVLKWRICTVYIHIPWNCHQIHGECNDHEISWDVGVNKPLKPSMINRFITCRPQSGINSPCSLISK